MTEAEWLDCTDPETMLEFLRGKASRRRMRLFAVACCRRIWHLLVHEESRRAVEVAERYADGLAGEDERRDAYAAAAAVCSYPSEELTDPEAIDSYATEAALCAVFGDDDYPPIPTYATTCAIAAARASANAVRCAAGVSADGDKDEAEGVADRAYEEGLKDRSDLVREVFGNPFRPVAFDPTWLAPEVVALARFIYDERAFDRLPILADALEEEGCGNEDILDHCRGSGEHARGCWVIDTILGSG
jgi:hypothetical protein